MPQPPQDLYENCVGGQGEESSGDGPTTEQHTQTSAIDLEIILLFDIKYY